MNVEQVIRELQSRDKNITVMIGSDKHKNRIKEIVRIRTVDIPVSKGSQSMQRFYVFESK